jgi:aquaporin Z
LNGDICVAYPFPREPISASVHASCNVNLSSCGAGPRSGAADRALMEAGAMSSPGWSHGLHPLDLRVIGFGVAYSRRACGWTASRRLQQMLNRRNTGAQRRVLPGQQLWHSACVTASPEVIVESPRMAHRLAAELFGTFWLVLGGCGSAVFAATVISDSGLMLGIGFLGVAIAFGLTVLTGVYAFGTVSGGHFNPAVTLGAALARRVEWKALPLYWIVQVIGGLIGGLVIYVIAKGRPGFDPTGNMAANGYGAHSPSGYTLWAVLLAEMVLTAVFLLIILGSTEDRAPKGFAGLAIGLTLTLIHLVSIPISNTSVNPARSTAVAFFNGAGAPGQLWAFWLAPLVGAAIAGVVYPFLFGRHEELAERPVRDDALERGDAGSEGPVID